MGLTSPNRGEQLEGVLSYLGPILACEPLGLRPTLVSEVLDLRPTLAYLGFLTRVQLHVRLHGMGHEQQGHADILSDHINIYTNALHPGTY